MSCLWCHLKIHVLRELAQQDQKEHSNASCTDSAEVCLVCSSCKLQAAGHDRNGLRFNACCNLRLLTHSCISTPVMLVVHAQSMQHGKNNGRRASHSLQDMHRGTMTRLSGAQDLFPAHHTLPVGPTTCTRSCSAHDTLPEFGPLQTTITHT